jgi:hypothetical protein
VRSVISTVFDARASCTLARQSKYLIDRLRIAHKAGDAIDRMLTLGVALGLFKKAGAFQRESYLLGHGLDELEIVFAQGMRGIIVDAQRADGFTVDR